MTKNTTNENIINPYQRMLRGMRALASYGNYDQVAFVKHTFYERPKLELNNFTVSNGERQMFFNDKKTITFFFKRLKKRNTLRNQADEKIKIRRTLFRFHFILFIYHIYCRIFLLRGRFRLIILDID